MDKQIHPKAMVIDEDTLIGCSKGRIKQILGDPDCENPEEWIYVLSVRCYGLFKKRLHLFYSKDKVRDYYIGI